ncbi:uncharacterized protein LOC124209084 [Daphnia pulex]|uniref:uncharacterized protein LOC124209084 n=1 Tax=Daphnia pulex TaxID=6669 RepID=UPI001EDFA246|nr:uncharacterized protein LOC124209084 [Daphnia pulex]
MSPPFDVTGVDFAGPVHYIRGSNAKSWICLFTCAVTRALHLELVQTLTAVGFLMAFNRFVSRFGICRIVYSDNAKTFHRANKDLAEIWKGAEPEILTDLANRGIMWKFIPEALIKITGTAHLTEEELRTTLCKIEAVVNSRPLTFVYNDHEEVQRLIDDSTPITQSATETNATQRELVERVEYYGKLTADFKKRWHTEYLQERALHFKHQHRVEPIRIGEVVLIQEDNMKRRQWDIGVIKETIPSSDGVVRQILLRTASGQLRRPVQRLCELEINENNPWENELLSVVQNDAEAEEIHPSVSFADAISQPEENQPELLQDVPQDVQQGGECRKLRRCESRPEGAP